jgi:hypothetical protein
MSPWREPGDHLVGATLARLAEDPTDRLADEELALLDHRVSMAPESPERRARLQRLQLGQQRRPADPEVRIGSPSVKDRLGFDRMNSRLLLR